MNLSKLEKMGNGNPDFISKLLLVYIEESKKQITSLAHKIKPSLYHIGIQQLEIDLRRIEKRRLLKIGAHYQNLFLIGRN
ncbi:MAG: HPt (histidine-containing phosphotransfer) domain-containing protein [Arenicella sp.]|jgi:HPt (histidine-containing phosphotransfer) domain-containing protein